MSTAIEFENISKQYRLGLVSTKTLSHDIRRFWITNVLGKEDPYLKIGETNDRSTKGSSEYVWALRDINFKVEQGDVVGIIGKNGAGKSTLLKLLSKVTGPTTGVIRAKGRIGSLLEVGTGFHQEMTGRENIYLNGAILGMTKAEITKKLDEIIDFSGCERYIDTPVKRYSSGMMVRLGFAVAAHLDPEILVVDEVLAVGDAEFQKKAIGKMQDVSKGEGRTVLFVSHNMASVKSLCHHGILLENGMVKDTGLIDPIVNHYLRGDSDVENHKIWTKVEFSAPGFELLEIGVRKANGNYEDLLHTDDELLFTTRYRITEYQPCFNICFYLKNEMGEQVFMCRDFDNVLPFEHEIGEYEQTFRIPGNFLNSGAYFVMIAPVKDNNHVICCTGDAISFNLIHKEIAIGNWMGREKGDITPRFKFEERLIK